MPVGHSVLGILNQQKVLPQLGFLGSLVHNFAPVGQSHLALYYISSGYFQNIEVERFQSATNTLWKIDWQIAEYSLSTQDSLGHHQAMGETSNVVQEALKERKNTVLNF